MKTAKRIAVVLGAIALVLGVVSLVVIRSIGAWNLVFPNRTHETVAPELPEDLASPAVLVFTKTNGFRHKDAIAAGVPLFEEIAKRRGWAAFHTENGAVFNGASLARFGAVIFHNASGDLLSEDQEMAFVRYLERGGGWLGVHAAGDGSHKDWRWYTETLIGSDYAGHILNPQFQVARSVVEDREHPATLNLPAEWQHEEEWYSWERSPRQAGVHVLISVDESTYTPEAKFMGMQGDLRMGDHPVVWTRCVGRGRTLYSALGHLQEAYDTPEYRALLDGALAWVMRTEGTGCDG